MSLRKQPNRKPGYNTRTTKGKTPDQILGKLGLTRDQVARVAFLSRPGIMRGGEG